MVSSIRNVYSGLLKVIKLLLIVLSSALIIVVFANVVSRYFLNFALAWSDETARFLFIWVTFLAAILANANNEHMNLDIVIQKVPEKTGKILLVIANIVVLIVLSVLIKGGITITVQNYNWMTPALEISYGLVYSIVPVGSVILMLQIITKLIKIVKSLFGSSNSSKGGS